MHEETLELQIVRMNEELDEAVETIRDTRRTGKAHKLQVRVHKPYTQREVEFLIAIVTDIEDHMDGFVEQSIATGSKTPGKVNDNPPNNELMNLIRSQVTPVLAQDIMLDWNAAENAALLDALEHTVAAMAGSGREEDLAGALAHIKGRVYHYLSRMSNRKFLEIAFARDHVEYGDIEGHFAVFVRHVSSD